jgi:acyl transferase domain-containing protein
MGNADEVTTMESWIKTAREAVRRSQVVRAELRQEAKSMLENGEHAAAKRIFEDILEEETPDTDYGTDAPIKSTSTST